MKSFRMKITHPTGGNLNILHDWIRYTYTQNFYIIFICSVVAYGGDVDVE